MLPISKWARRICNERSRSRNGSRAGYVPVEDTILAPCPLDLGRQVVAEVQMHPSSITVMQPETMIPSKKDGQRNGADPKQPREPGMEVFASWLLLTYTRWCSLGTCGLSGALPGKRTKPT